MQQFRHWQQSPSTFYSFTIATGRNLPAVERPEMHAVFDTLPDESEPRNTSVCGFRYRPLYVELEDGFGSACSEFGQPAPTRIARAGRAVSAAPITHKINVDILVCRPVTLEIIKEERPVERQAVLLEVLQRERKTVVNTYKRRRRF